MSSAIDLNAGALAPVARESDLGALPLSGTLPPELDGWLVRNGPNPVTGRFAGQDLLSWWPEAAMLHAVGFAEGRASGYRNRWLRTRRWAEHHAPEQFEAMPDTNPNINVIRHAGSTLALAEGGMPLEISPGLDTLGPAHHLPAFAQGMGGHPKVDPETAELVGFRAHWMQPYLRYMVAAPDGTTRVDLPIELPRPSMIHDLAITASHSLLPDLNVIYDFSMLKRGHRMPLRWDADRPARIGVLPRHAGDADALRWFEIAPCFIQHVINAWDADASTIVLDVIRYPWFLRLSPDGQAFEPNPIGTPWRYRFDLEAGTVEEGALSDLALELPRIDERRTGRAYRYCYAVEQPGLDEMRGIVRLDVLTGQVMRHAVPPGDQNSEPVFVPRAGSSEDDDGWVLACVYRAATDTSDVVVLDARRLDAEPVATVHLPVRIPAGFHGAWLPRD
ncbi:carotenoid oxygenase [Burkholderia gladioli]|uniref:carotenoid oxygenase family protein n=1 Tax=Burkholderia gladioli TaxID=28095 RepID=UPI000CDAA2A6|nr:carotenoid oxygenase family protein [Burkholderia gladioli]POS06588.1 carotenoid oxygenase [Burkholderia gladioli]